MKAKAIRLDNGKSIVGYPFIKENKDGSKSFFIVTEDSAGNPEFVLIEPSSLCAFCTWRKGMDLYEDDKLHVKFPDGKVKKYKINYGHFLFEEQNVLGWYLDEETCGETKREYEVRSLGEVLNLYDFTKEEEM